MASPTKQNVVWWIKKDFRLSDNPALTAALESRHNVMALFIIEPTALSAPETSAFHVQAWIEAVCELKQQLESAGGSLCVLHGDAVEQLEAVYAKTKFNAIYSHQEVGNNRTFTTDKKVAVWCRSRKVDWHELRQTGVFRRLKNRDHRSKLWKQWISEGPQRIPLKTDLRRVSIPDSVRDLQTPEVGRLSLKRLGFELSAASKRHRQRVSESHAQATLDDFLSDRGLAYSGGISSPNTAFTAGSRLSVHLAWGTISGRAVYARTERQIEVLKESPDPDAGRWRRSLNSFKARMNWRDHFMQRLETEPTMEFHSLNRAYDNLPTTRYRKKHLRAWVNAETGFPLVDACIRCAQTTGFINFRMRCMITSVACHALRLDWREINWPMARWWADYEPGIHIAQLQMQAGVVGINTLRTYNPAKQISDHDPKAKFVKRWLPELRGLSVNEIVAHQDDPSPSYIKPIVNWKSNTTAMRTDYYALRREPETKEGVDDVLKKHGSRKPPSSRKRKTAASRAKLKPTAKSATKAKKSIKAKAAVRSKVAKKKK